MSLRYGRITLARGFLFSLIIANTVCNVFVKKILSTDSYDFGDPKSVSEDPEVREKLEAWYRGER